MDMQSVEITQFTPEAFEENRQKLLKKFKAVSDKVETADNRIAAAKKVSDEYAKSSIEENIQALDVVAFVQINSFESEVDNTLFGEVSKIIESAIDDELQEIMETSNDKSFKRQITPQRLIASAEKEKTELFIDDITDGLDTEATITIRCMEMYNEICQDALSVSERSRKKQMENQQLLYIITSKLRFPEQHAENHVNESVLYTVALVSNVKDGTRPSLTNYKERIVQNINKAINSLTLSRDVKSAIKVFDTATMSMDECKKYIEADDSSSAKKVKDAIQAIQEVYKEKVAGIEDVYKSDLEH